MSKSTIHSWIESYFPCGLLLREWNLSLGTIKYHSRVRLIPITISRMFNRSFQLWVADGNHSYGDNRLSLNNNYSELSNIINELLCITLECCAFFVRAKFIWHREVRIHSEKEAEKYLLGPTASFCKKLFWNNT